MKSSILSIEALYKKTYIGKRVKVFLLKTTNPKSHRGEFWSLYPPDEEEVLIQKKTGLVNSVYYDRDYEDVAFWMEIQDIGVLKIRE